MSFLIRKITKSKWVNVNSTEDKLDPNDISADALTSCLRTSQKTLSFWVIENIDDEEELNKIILAVIANSNTTSLSKVDILYFEYNKDFFLNKNIKLLETKGDTAIKSCVDKHIDMIELNLEKIVFIVNLFCEALNNNQSKQFTQAKVKNLLIEHLHHNPNDTVGLDTDLLNKLKKP